MGAVQIVPPCFACWSVAKHVQNVFEAATHALHAVQVLVTAFTVVPSRSGAVRTFEQRTVLEQFNPRCVAVSLSGYIFFGSSVKISDKVMEVTLVMTVIVIVIAVVVT